MTTTLDLLVLTGQSNAQIMGSQTFTETIDGAPWTGTALQLACVEASYALGLGPSGITPVFQAGTITNGVVTGDGTTFAGTSLIQNSNPTYTNPTWSTSLAAILRMA